jgi:plastocyanin
VLQSSGKDRTDASNAVVWIEGLHGSERPSAAPRGEMKSASKRFTPRVVAVPVHSKVEFPNVDPIYHNVFSVSAGNRFDLGLYKSGASKEQTFEEPGLVRVYCNIHPQMVGFVMVVDSDRSAVTGADGAFRFEGIPPGSYVLHAWHEEGAEVKVPVTVHGTGDAPISIPIDVSGFRAEPHKNKYGKDYKPPSSDAEDERY